jgi:hypothetical protein
MGRRATAGRDQKIIQGQRRDAFFKQMRRRGGVPRLPTQGAATSPAVEAEAADPTTAEEAPEIGAEAEAGRETEQ